MTPRQKTICKELIEGKTYQQIGDHLCISKYTVKFHCREIYREHKVNNRKQLMAHIITGKIKISIT
ncbi:helix-turn-helix domain-containing protein [Agarilytica rhodophyticola]|uniref:helix-turn-helix transcriptional regulator n=1 Tax=Agarilytica rhodophyticola TaxID=1737490 RepID=UPI000B349C68